MTNRSKAISVLTMNTLAFTVCFACWMLNGVLVTFLVEHGVFRLTESQIGWLIGIPVLTGSIVRLPIGILTDKYGGRIVFGALMLVSAVPMYLLSYADSYASFLVASLGFGLAGGSFAVGIAYTSVWFSKERQGTALGVFGAGNAGSAVTSMLAPVVLLKLTANATHLDGWRTLPKIYAAGLVAMTVVFFLFTHSKKVDDSNVAGLGARLAPLKNVRVWRFGLYYFLVFGGFVALSQWLIPYYVNAYAMSVAAAGMMASIFSLPSGLIRALGGWMSDHFGARRVMYWVLGSCLLCCALLIVPRMEVELPGKGVMAARSGVVKSVSPEQVVVGERVYKLHSSEPGWRDVATDGMLVLPTKAFWQTPAVKAGDKVQKRQLLAAGVTHIHFQANVWIFTALVFIVGFMMGIGKAAVYRHIPDYFPKAVGVVGGVVGVVGGLGGFFSPIMFGYLLERTGIWTTSWMFLALVSAVCLVWMHLVIQRMMRQQTPELMRRMETGGVPQPATPEYAHVHTR
jgi:NNP family nitrate/nitrite transporter-like MFS transporter